MYPSITERLKAAFVDALILITLMFGFSQLFMLFAEVSDQMRIIAFAFIFVFYDPLLTSLLGGTIGHLVMGLNVKKASNEESNISFGFALLRFTLKGALGLISILTMGASEKKQAIHDLAAQSVIVYK